MYHLLQSYTVPPCMLSFAILTFIMGGTVDPGKHISLHDGKIASDIDMFGGTDITRELCSGQTQIFQGNRCSYITVTLASM